MITIIEDAKVTESDIIIITKIIYFSWNFLCSWQNYLTPSFKAPEWALRKPCGKFGGNKGALIPFL